MTELPLSQLLQKNIPQSPFNQSTNAPDDAAKVVLPAVPIEWQSILSSSVYPIH